MSPGRRAAIVGIAEVPPRRETRGETTLGMIAEVSRRALEDAGVHHSKVDALFVGPQVGETPQHVPATVAEYLGLQPSVAGLVDLGGASAASMVWRAGAAIEFGMCSTALCVLANTRDPANPLRSPNRNPIREFDVPFGASGANQAYAMVATAHMAQFGTSEEELARIAVLERMNAQLNPDAIFYGAPITVEDVLESPIIASPLHLLEAVMPCAGAAAVVVTAGNYAGECRHPPVFLRGAGEKVTHRALSQAPELTTSPLKDAIAHAYRMAGTSVHEIDVFSFYDCYTIMVGITIEDAGLCAKGEFGPFVAANDFSPVGRTPINTHGGQLGCGQADLAGGMGHVVEAVHQLRGSGGRRQVPDARLALVTGNGATMSEGSALILGAD